MYFGGRVYQGIVRNLGGSGRYVYVFFTEEIFILVINCIRYKNICNNKDM